MVGRSRFGFPALVAVILLALAAVLAFAPGAVAQNPAQTPVPAESAAGSAGGGEGAADAEVSIIMDASSSMLQPDEGGTRLDVAKQASIELVDSLPDTARVGMIAYGTEVTDAPENHAEGCQDIRTLAPVGQVDKDLLRSEISGLEATGYTPIGNALRAAADELSPDASERSIVLVSDGIDTCAPPPPCEVAEELADEGIGLAVHVVGFRADEATRAELECISSATGGTYRQADDAQSLADSLKFLTQRAIVGYETTGTDFEFSDTAEDAMYVGQGLYQTTVETTPGGATSAPDNHIRVAVPEGHTAHVAITPIPEIDLGDPGGGQGVVTYVEAENDSSHRCSRSRDSSSTSGGGFEAPESAVIAINRQVEPDCDDSAWVVLAQFGSSSGDQVQELRVEMSVQFEPLPGEESATWPAGDTGSAPDADPVALAGAQPVSGGNSFNNAAEVSEGAFTDSVVPGEFRYYSFPVEWGQRPVVTIRTGPSVREAADTIHFDMFSPVRQGVAGDWTPFYDTVEEATFALDRPVLYRNREANQGGQDRALAGRHYLAVSLNVTGSGPLGVDQPFEFAIRMDGDPAEGPVWEPVNEPGPEPSAEPISGEAAAPSGEGTAQDDNDDDDADLAVADEDGAMSSTVWLVLGGAVLLLVVVSGGLWMALRGSRTEKL